ncbi:hypothetical protein Prudu_1293S000100 [Prunus dulcis]|uniref:DUF4218 domain-containing protein n=1 Tax=Prunus dulcis TaxID=3755 RepID=A0A5H2XT70_PRUDU|nr:hypothetical protein Prudu_1293S000100 [Prunus dulcis]
MASRRLKKSVRNRAKPEGSIIEAWVQYESLTFCGMYLKDVETAFNRPQCNNDGGMRKEKLSVFAQSARPFGYPGRGESFSRNDMGDDEARTSITFVARNTVNKLKSSNSPTYSDELYNLAFGPIRAELFSGCILTASNFWGLHEMTSCVCKTAVSMSQVEAKVRTLISMANSQLSFNCFTKIDTK